MTAGAWVGLFSGGKDSSWALHLALERGLPVERLLTVHPPGDSYMYHVPETGIATLAAESVGIPLVDVEPDGLGGGDWADGAPVADSGARGDAEVEPLAAALADLGGGLPGGVAGVTVGAVASEYQASRIESLADELGIDVFAPLWGRDPPALAREMIDAGLEIRIVQVAAAGLDESWLGRRLDARALEELEALHESHGVHVLGEGGEFETLVTDGPHMDRPIEIDYEVEWEGTRGRIRITGARLAERP